MSINHFDFRKSIAPLGTTTRNTKDANSNLSSLTA